MTVRKPCLLPVSDMDFWIVAAVTVLLVWAWSTFTTTAPGWVHLLLTAAVFLLIWRIVLRGTAIQAPASGEGSTTSRR